MQKSIGVAFITQIAGLGGGETSLLNLLQEMNKSGQRSILIAPAGQLTERARNLQLKVYSAPLPAVHMRCGVVPTFSFSTVIWLCRLFKKEAIDIVHTESLRGLYYGGVAGFLSGIPCVSTYHGYWDLGHPLTNLFLRRFCRRMYPVSPSVASELTEIFDNTEKLKVISLSISPDFVSDFPSKQVIREQLGLAQDAFVIMQVARIQEVKGHLYLLEALKKLLQKTSKTCQLQLVFVGDVMTPSVARDIEYKRTLQQRVSSEGLENYISFLGHRDDVPLLMRAADILVNPSEKETFGMAIVEAMSSGTPVLATNVGGPATILRNEQTGLLVPPKAPEALADGILRLLSDPLFARTIAKRAQAEALQKYSPTVRYEALLKEYMCLLGKAT